MTCRQRGLGNLRLSRRFLAIFFWTLIAATAQTPAQSTEEMPSLPFNNAPYRVGERLTYNVSFSNFNTAAHVELFVAARGSFFNREGLQLRAHVETTGVVSAALYSINNDYTSYVDAGSGLPFRTQQVIREAGRTSDSSSDYNQPAGIAAIPGKTLAGGFPGTYDLVSAFYRFRSLPLMEGSIYRISVRSDPDQYDVELRVTGRELVKTNVGSFQTIATQLRIPGNSQANNYKVRIYFSDDERHVPVLITAQHPSGEIRAELVASELPATAQPVAATVNTAITPTPSPIGAPVADGHPIAEGGTLGGLPFNVGEQLNYNIFLASVAQPVGQASFQVRARTTYFNHDGLQLSAKAQTTNAAQKLFYANDQINSYVDPTTLVPFRTDLALVEGQRRKTQTITFDQDRGTAIMDKGQRVEIPVGTHDYISVMYALRSFNLAPPKRNAVSLLVNNRPSTLFVTSLKREVIELGGQKIPAIQLSLTTDDPQPDKYALRLWVSEDRRRLPLRLTANTQLGPLRADLAIIPTARQ
ncbi:MAG TPA: DUF3108 domain-containing protein [Pyrinomonadaceae bacterium]|nr:DUF3108 domain-containing protein [Pyrinomonadaceae bacterium]